MWGRGGAGNIQQAVEASKQRAPEVSPKRLGFPHAVFHFSILVLSVFFLCGPQFWDSACVAV